MPPRRNVAKKGKKKQVIQEEISENLENDEDLNLMDQANMGFEQEQLTAEEKEKQEIKTLTSNNPQAPHNVCLFNFKERVFKHVDQVEHLVFHIQYDGNILLKDSDDARYQDEFWEDKNKMNKTLLDRMNQEVKETFGKDPLEGDNKAQKKSLRNQFNFQERSSQTFNMPIKSKGIKTTPP